MIGGKMGVSHCHFDVGMTENSLQNENISTVHHEMAREGMPQNMGHLTVWQYNASPFNR